jgi:hypothetical protein
MIIRLQGEKPSRERSQSELIATGKSLHYNIGDYFATRALDAVETAAVMSPFYIAGRVSNEPIITCIGTAISGVYLGAKAIYDFLDVWSNVKDIRFLRKELKSLGARI